MSEERLLHVDIDLIQPGRYQPRRMFAPVSRPSIRKSIPIEIPPFFQKSAVLSVA